ncbi:MAG: methyltransferase [Planctomycetota bacterium]
MEGPPPPDEAALEKLLDELAPLAPAPLCPEVRVFQAPDLYALWAKAEELVGAVVNPPFWAVPWPAGLAIARVLLDSPVWARARRCLDVGVGGGVVALAAAKAGASRVVGVDVDPWALAVARIAARRNGVELELVEADLSERDPPEMPDLILAADLEYEKERSPRVRQRLEALVAAGATLLTGDAGRLFFKKEGLHLVASYTLDVSKDVEGHESRVASVYSLE